MVITSTHGDTGLRHVLLGSTVEQLVRLAHCPVLVVPSHRRANFDEQLWEILAKKCAVIRNSCRERRSRIGQICLAQQLESSMTN
jgi:hypothetical protein